MINLRETFAGSLVVAWQEGTGGQPRPQIITLDEARGYNEKQYGIFFTVQSFDRRRVKENLVRINAWAIDMDASAGTKEFQRKLIERSPLIPSLVVETKSGYHVYWLAKNATADMYRPILEKYLIPFFKADPAAKDLCRVLRRPGYYHWKNILDPFLVGIVHEENCAYTQEEMIFFFSRVMQEATPRKKNYTMAELKNMCGGLVLPKNKKYGFKDFANSANQDSTFWHRANRLDCKDALKKLSGTNFVAGEVYDFIERRSSGGYTLAVNGKPSGAWIDVNGRIGSTSGGGPSVVNWLLWFKHSPREVAEIMKGFFNV